MFHPPGHTAAAVTRVVALTVAGTMLVAACSSDAPASQTAQIELDAESPLNELLLTPEDTAVFSGFEGAEIRDLDEVPLFENPDPRGPCGARVSAPSFEGAAARAVGGGTINLIQLAVPSSSEYEGYVDELIADSGPPCDDYTSTTNSGEIQQTTEIAVFDTTGDGVRGVTWTNLVEVDERFIYVGTIAMHADDVVTFVQIQSPTPVPEDALQILAGLAVTRLRGLR